MLPKIQLYVLLYGAIMFLNMGCVTVETWDSGPPRDSTQLSEDDRHAEYRKFVVRDVGTHHGKSYVELKADDDDDARRYSLDSFFPTLVQISPKSKELVDDAISLQAKDKYADIAMGAGIALAVFGPVSLLRNVGWLAVAGGAVGNGVLNHLKKEQLEAIMRQYNADLHETIFAPRRTKELNLSLYDRPTSASVAFQHLNF